MRLMGSVGALGPNHQTTKEVPALLSSQVSWIIISFNRKNSYDFQSLNYMSLQYLHFSYRLVLLFFLK